MEKNMIETDNRIITPRALAFYLPQFYRTKENDEWWGKGFTDWISMQEAKPLFVGHDQPKNPLNGYTYNLLDKSTMQWQSNLLKKYGVDGICIYHYWFKGGRRVLEKPSENLLEWKDINIPFCFCWANEPWVRTWCNLGNGNVWTSFHETTTSNDNGILLEQEYGSSKDWLEHFNYLLPFFQDSRYIKINNRPLFLFYRIDEIDCIDEMLRFANDYLKKAGFDGLYVIGRNYGQKKIDLMDADLAMEPINTMREFFPDRFINENNNNVAKYIPYEDIWKHTLKRKRTYKKTYWCGFVRYDTTPRRGKYGSIVYNDTPEKFKLYLTELFAKSAASQNEFVFINAWNEWGEGMYLEPDEKTEYGYLEAFEYAKKHYTNEIYKYGDDYANDSSLIERLRKENGRFVREGKLLNSWLYINRSKKCLAERVFDRGFRTIGVYGMGMLGKQLINEFNSVDDMNIFGLDENAENIKMDIDIFSPDSEIPQADLIVVSNVHIYEDIRKKLEKRSLSPVKSLAELIEMVS